MLPDCLKNYRLDNNLTQKQMAKKLRTSQSYYSGIERGVIKPGFTMIKRISRLLKLEQSYVRTLL